MMNKDDLDDGLKSKKRKVQEEMDELRELRDQTDFEKNDYAALIIAGLTTILPVVGVILVLYFLISMLFFG
jgi:Fe2+ transport system protein B